MFCITKRALFDRDFCTRGGLIPLVVILKCYPLQGTKANISYRNIIDFFLGSDLKKASVVSKKKAKH